MVEVAFRIGTVYFFYYYYYETVGIHIGLQTG